MRNNDKLQFKAGYGIFFYSLSIPSVSVRNNKTHNYGEVSAVEDSIEKILEIHEAENDETDLYRQYIIVSDSQYCIKSITQYMYVWREFGWRRHTGKEIHYVEKWKHIYEMLKKLDDMEVDIGFLHVRSHLKQPTDINSLEYFLWYGNQCADRLATGKTIRPPHPLFNPFLRGDSQ